MLFQVIGEDAHRTRGAAYLAQSIIQLLCLRRVGSDEAVGAIHCRLRAGERAASAYQREIQRAKNLVEVVADLIKGQLVDLVRDTFEAGFGGFELSRSSGELNRPL